MACWLAQFERQIQIAKCTHNCSRGYQNRSKVIPGTLRWHSGCSRGVPEASRSIPKAPQRCPRSASGAIKIRLGRPWRAARGAPRRPETLGDGQRLPKSVQSCVQVAQVVCKASATQFLVKFRVFRKVCEPSEVLRLSAKTRIWPSA